MKKLNSGEHAALRNSFGKSINSPDLIDPQSVYQAFYKTHVLDWSETPESCSTTIEDAYFVAACLWSYQGENGDLEFAEAWKLSMESESDSFNERLVRVLSMDFGDAFIEQFADLARFLVKKGYKINCETLALDLWDYYWDKKKIQRKWFRIINN